MQEMSNVQKDVQTTTTSSSVHYLSDIKKSLRAITFKHCVCVCVCVRGLDCPPPHMPGHFLSRCVFLFIDIFFQSTPPPPHIAHTPQTNNGPPQNGLPKPSSFSRYHHTHLTGPFFSILIAITPIVNNVYGSPTQACQLIMTPPPPCILKNLPGFTLPGTSLNVTVLLPVHTLLFYFDEKEISQIMCSIISNF